MHAMQYQFEFSPGFDLQTVRDRVAELGPRFNDLPGLHYKAFLLSEASGEQPALYAPFYVWRRPEGMREFLLSDSFTAVCARYGRPGVHQWVPLWHQDGNFMEDPPAYATREFAKAAEFKGLVDLAERESERSRRVLMEPGAHSVFVGVDPVTWKLIRMTLWTSRPSPRDGSHLFEVAYLSRPERSAHLLANVASASSSHALQAGIYE